MKQLRIYALASLLTVFASCSKSNDNTTSDKPANVEVVSVVSTDNSGNVAFTATGTNVASYEFDFGNGIFETSTTGNITYKYPVAGTYTVKVTAKAASGEVTVKSFQVVVSAAEALIFAEEFNTPGAPDPGRWGFEIGNNNGWGNNELEYYTNRTDNATVANGNLKITLKKEDLNGFGYTSARLISKGKFSFKYGRIEIKAKLPIGGGTWPAVWAMGDNISSVAWPACGEIDIMEHVGNRQNTIFSTLHYPNHSGGNGVSNTTVIANASTEYHLYTMDWTATKLEFAVDGKVFHTVANDPSLPFNQNFFLILNVAMGGNFGGAVDPAFTSSSMEIDYIRIYK